MSAAPHPRAILRVLWGKAAGRKVAIPVGRSVRVGRDEDVELTLPHDRKLSLHHFTLDNTGDYIRLFDSPSSGGTKVNGLPFVSGPIDAGTVVEAGDTIFRVFLEGETKTRHADRNPERLAGAAHALTELRAAAAEHPLFAVLDAAKERRILTLLDECVDEAYSLYDGIEGAGLERVAPHIVRFAPDSGLLERIVTEGWGRTWGIFLTSESPMVEVRRHLRRFLMVTPEDTSKRMYFRYYDPTVLRDFFPLATPLQKSQLFAEVASFLFEGPRYEVVRVQPEEQP